MNPQKALLLQFREAAIYGPEFNASELNYDFQAGMWKTTENIPCIKIMLEEANNLNTQTTKSATREGVDQSEVSNGLPQTTMTRSREGVDQSDVVSFSATQTLITKSREGVDSSEYSTYSLPATKLSDSREGIDQSEVSS